MFPRVSETSEEIIHPFPMHCFRGTDHNFTSYNNLSKRSAYPDQQPDVKTPVPVMSTEAKSRVCLGP